MKKEKGFTLTEVLIICVVVVVGLFLYFKHYGAVQSDKREKMLNILAGKILDNKETTRQEWDIFKDNEEMVIKKIREIMTARKIEREKESEETKKEKRDKEYEIYINFIRNQKSQGP